jgi:malonyl-CoA O-methyltransferase
MLNSQDIKKRFDQAAHCYDAHSQIQQAVCRELIMKLKQQQTQFQIIIDIACGTGLSTWQLHEQLSYHQLHGLDISAHSLKRASARFNALPHHFFNADFDNWQSPQMPYQLIFSNMGLQWSTHLGNTLQQLSDNLAPRGLLAFSLPVAGTFCELKPCHRNAQASLMHVKQLIQDTALKLLYSKQKCWVAHYQDTLSALRAIKATGASALSHRQKHSGLKTRRTLQQFFQHSNNQLSYEIGFFIARK